MKMICESPKVGKGIEDQTEVIVKRKTE